MVVDLYEPCTFAMVRKSVSSSTALLTQALWESVACEEQKANRDGKITTMREKELQDDKPVIPPCDACLFSRGFPAFAVLGP